MSSTGPFDGLFPDGETHIVFSRLALIDMIERYEGLKHALIVASECYTTQFAPKDTYLIVELRHENQTLWARLDYVQSRRWLVLSSVSSNAVSLLPR